MTMFRCEDCGNLFENGETWIEPHGERRMGCPLCGGEFMEVKPCPICGTYEKEDDEAYCKNCKADVKKRFASLVNNEFTLEERKLLNEMYEGEYI